MGTRPSKRKAKPTNQATEAYTHAKGSASTALHASVDPLAFYRDVLPMLPTRSGGVIIDVGGGIGRDTLMFADHAKGLEVYSIDPDPVMWEKAQAHYPGRLVRMEDAVSSDKPVFLADSLPYLAELKRLKPSLKADFILCNAVMMFIKPEERQTALNTMASLLKPNGSLVVRFRTEDLKDGMHPITVDEIDRLCLRTRFGHATRLYGTESIPDPAGRTLTNGRPMMWHQRILIRTP
jgi:trans-aconitate methyltransferase